jgi:hypothetical protein
MTESRARNTFDDIEAPEADVLEQHTSAGRHDADESGEEGEQRSTPLEADDADAAEQGLDAEYDDEDEYRD